MGISTGIEWCHHTFNPWRGCTKVSPGCTNCYAEKLSARNPAALGTWGPRGQRVVAAESYWRQPLRWDRESEAAGERRRVFCASLADVFEDRPELTVPRCRLLRLIHQTPSLDWLLLTKHPEGIMERLQECASQEDRDRSDNGRLGINDGACLASQWRHGAPLANVWLGVSIENQQYADNRIPLLLRTTAAVRFLSLEPLLEPVDLAARGWLRGSDQATGVPSIDWVIVGGESGGKNVRACDLAWVRSIVRQCQEAAVPVFVKQVGSRPKTATLSLWFRDRKGGNPDEWPSDLRVREFPVVADSAARCTTGNVPGGW